MIDSLPIGFPGLGIEKIDFKNYISVFGYAIYWYAIIICFGLLVAYIYADRRAEKLNVSRNALLDGLLFCVPIGIIGARLFYVFFAPPGEITTLKDIIDIRRGGLSIFGALIAVSIFLVFFCKRKKQLLGNVLDLTSLGFMIGQTIGRWGNFVNREVYGIETNLPWRMTIDGVARHPLFLYESLWNLIGFIILHNVSKKRKFPGQIVLMYMVWYGVGRALLESLRVNQYVLVMGNIPMSQIVSIAFAVIGLYLLIVKYIDLKKGVVFSFDYEEAAVETKKKKTTKKVATKKSELKEDDYIPMYGFKGDFDEELAKQEAEENSAEDITEAAEEITDAADSVAEEVSEVNEEITEAKEAIEEKTEELVGENE